MENRTLDDLLSRIKYNVELLNEVTLSYSKASPGKKQSIRIRLNQVISRIKSLNNQVIDRLTKGTILKITYTRFNGQETHKYEGLLSQVTKKEFLTFVEEVNKTQPDREIKILEIQEIPAFIKKVPL